MPGPAWPGLRRPPPARVPSAWWWARATTAATAWWPHGCCVRTAIVVRVLAIAPTDELRGDPATNLERLPGDPPEAWDPAALEGAGVVVDALLGTGFEGEPREPVAGAIAAINAQPAPVVACDVPSGVNATTGEVEGEAVRAAVTATFHGAEGRALGGAREGPRRRGGGGGHRRAAGRPRAGAGGPRVRAGAGAVSPPRRGMARSSTRAWWWWPAARPGSPALPPWSRSRRSAPAPATCRWRCPHRCSRWWSCACSSR